MQTATRSGGRSPTIVGLATLFSGIFFAAPLLSQDLSQPYVPNQVLVQFVPGAAAGDRAVLRRALSARGGRRLGLVNGLEVIQTGLDVPQALAVLANNPNVLYAEPDYVLQPVQIPNDYYFNLEWGLDNTGQDIRGANGNVDADIDMPEAWDTLASSQTIVAIIDTGTQWDHEDLVANIWENEDEVASGTDSDNNGFVDDMRGWDFFSSDDDPYDTDGHGTHTAGTVGATRDNGIGIAGICGACRLMPLRFLGPVGGYTSDAISALAYAVANGATVSNNSWGGGAFSQALFNAIEAAGNAGHVFVAAAGNSGRNTDSFPDYPSSYNLPNIISVASTDHRDQLAFDSNYGLTSVDIGAPGVNIASTYWDPSTAEDDYWWNSGTSMAAPHVAGVVALLQAQDPSLSAAQVVDIVLRSARPVQNLVGITATGGLLNANNALNRVFPDPITTPPPPPASPPATPQNLVATDSTTGSAQVSWKAVEGADHYLLEREERRKNGRRTGGTWFEVPAQAAAGGTDTFEDATGPHKYLYYRVAAGDSVNNTNSFMSDWVHVAVTDSSGSDGGGSDDDGSGRCHPKRGC